MFNQNDKNFGNNWLIMSLFVIGTGLLAGTAYFGVETFNAISDFEAKEKNNQRKVVLITRKKAAIKKELQKNQAKLVVKTSSDVPKPEVKKTAKIVKKNVVATTHVVQKSYKPVQNCSLMKYRLPGKVNLYDRPVGVTHIKEPINYFRVYGRDVVTIRHQIWNCGPSRHIGKSHIYAISQSRMNFIYDTDQAGQICKLKNVKIGLNTVISAPIWNDNSASQYTKNRFNSFINGLLVHERGHGQIDFQYANILYNRLNNLQAGSCSELESKVMPTYKQLISELGVAQRNYEYRTNYGQHQGGWL